MRTNAQTYSDTYTTTTEMNIYLKQMENKRRRVRRSSGFDALTPEEQVAHVIEHWDEICTPVNIEVEYGPTIDDLEYCYDYYIPSLIERIVGTEFEPYKDEIVANMSALLLNN